MKLAKTLTFVALTLAASTSFAAKAKCDHRGQSGLFASTNPGSKVEGKKVVKTSTVRAVR